MIIPRGPKILLCCASAGALCGATVLVGRFIGLDHPAEFLITLIAGITGVASLLLEAAETWME